MTVELNPERIYTELSWLRQEVQGLRSKLDALAPAEPAESAHRAPAHRAQRGRTRRPADGARGRCERASHHRADPVGPLARADRRRLRRGAHPVPGVRRVSYFYEHQGEIEQDIARNRAALRKGPQKASPV